MQDPTTPTGACTLASCHPQGQCLKPFLSFYASCMLCSAALDVPVPHEALLDEASRRATYHANRAAAYLARYKEAQAFTTTAQEPAVPCEGSSNHNKGSEQCSACWREVGGVLDGQMLDGASAEARGQLLQAAVIDCRAALDLVPNHTKAHYR